MEDLAERLRFPDVPPLVAGAMAHLDLVMVHPFKDGNGRMARATQTLVLAREGILGGPARALPALAEAARGLRLRRSTYRALADIEDATATRDLRALVAGGLLLAEGEKRGRSYVASSGVRALAAEVRASQPSHSSIDPFDLPDRPTLR